MLANVQAMIFFSFVIGGDKPESVQPVADLRAPVNDIDGGHRFIRNGRESRRRVAGQILKERCRAVRRDRQAHGVGLQIFPALAKDSPPVSLAENFRHRKGGAERHAVQIFNQRVNQRLHSPLKGKEQVVARPARVLGVFQTADHTSGREFHFAETRKRRH